MIRSESEGALQAGRNVRMEKERREIGEREREREIV